MTISRILIGTMYKALVKKASPNGLAFSLHYYQSHQTH